MRLACLATASAVALAVAGIAPAWAQRAQEAPTADTGVAPVNVTPPPPPGFPGYTGDLVYGGEIQTHLQGQITHSSVAGGVKSEVFDDAQLAEFANYKSWLSLNGVTQLERNRQDNLQDYYPDRNEFFRSEGLTQRQLYLTVRPTPDIAAYGGKIHPAFGSAYEQAPGIFYNFGSDYEQDERVGFGGQVRLPQWLLPNARLSLETFFLDTSVLSHSLLSEPGLNDPVASRFKRYARSLYGPSNTGSLDSYTLALRGGTAEQGLLYQVSLTQEATDMPGGRTEYGESIGASYDPTGDGWPITPRLGVVPFAEYTHFDNYGGIAKLNRHYVVAGLTFVYGKWNFIGAGGIRKSTGGVSQDFDHQENVSFTYEVIPRLLIGAGYNFANIAAKSSNTLAPSLSYTLAF